jgi:hypothetical protein
MIDLNYISRFNFDLKHEREGEEYDITFTPKTKQLSHSPFTQRLTFTVSFVDFTFHNNIKDLWAAGNQSWTKPGRHK